MTFSSFEFLIFFAIVYGLYVVSTHRLQNMLLLVASYVFYGAWDWRFLSLIWISTAIDFWVGKRLETTRAERTRRLLVAISVVANLGMLGVFKYYNFFAGSLQELAGAFGWRIDWTTMKIVLPVGISFYTFQTLSYTLDIYRRKLKPTNNLIDFALFVAFFPQLVAGPIERAAKLLPRVASPRRITPEFFSRGAFLILLGLVKKMVVADGMATAVNTISGASVENISGVDVWVGTYLFAVQIYCDFSGYSDIARGLAKMLGFDLMVNFNIPYISTSPREFWRRWHISLSTWLRDYLYISLGGSRRGGIFTYRNLMLTMLLGGLWHGAAWNFVIWGFFHGALLCIQRLTGAGVESGERPRGFGPVLWWVARLVFFFHVTCIGWMLFRAQSLKQVADFGRLMFTDFLNFTLHVPRIPFSASVAFLVLLILELFQAHTGTSHFYQRWYRPLRTLVYAVLLILLLMGLSNAPSQFIYFQF